MTNKPFAPACERNAEPIYSALQKHLPADASILEIGSGTGQHAAYFAARQPHWQWQCSDQAEQLRGIAAWLDELPAGQLPPPLELDVLNGVWPQSQYDAVFSANTLHIMPWEASLALFRQLPQLLNPQGKLLIYGPFNYAGQFTSASNAQFNDWLKQHAPHQGIRDFEAVDQLARQAGLQLIADQAMPANNRLLCWQAST